jgi:hypothetical protein
MKDISRSICVNSGCRSALVFVAEALHDLVVALESGHHQDLLEKLRRLREREEHSGIHPARHKIVPRALGRALRKERRLNVDEAVAVQKTPHRLRDHVARDECLLEAGTPEVQVTVLESQAFRHVSLVLDHERQGLACVQDCEIAHQHLDLAGRQPGVHRVAGTERDRARDREHIAPDVARQLVGLGGRLR